MKVIAINGSPRKDGNTYQALSYMAEILKTYDIDTEIINIGAKPIQGCTACSSCFKPDAKGCVFNDDLVNSTAAKLRPAQGFILGSPTYCGGIAGGFKAFLDRLFYSNYAAGFTGKVAGLAVVARRSGGVEVVHQLANYLMLTQTLLAPSRYWALTHGLHKGEIFKDDEGMQILGEHAHNIAWLIRMINATKDSVPPFASANKVMTNFVR